MGYGKCDEMAERNAEILGGQAIISQLAAAGAALQLLDEVTPSTSRVSSAETDATNAHLAAASRPLDVRCTHIETKETGTECKHSVPVLYVSAFVAYTLISVLLIKSSCASLYTSTKYAEKPAIRTTRSW